jgi:alpha-glucosidase
MRSCNDIVAFKRRIEGEEILVLLNMAADPRTWHQLPRAEVLVSNAGDRTAQRLEGAVLLSADEGLVLKVLP